MAPRRSPSTRWKDELLSAGCAREDDTIRLAEEMDDDVFIQMKRRGVSYFKFVLTAETAVAKTAQMQRDEWIDRFTAAVTLHFLVCDGEVGLFCMVMITFEFSEAGSETMDWKPT